MNIESFARKAAILGHMWVIAVRFHPHRPNPKPEEYRALCPFADQDSYEEDVLFLVPDDVEEAREMRTVLFNQGYRGDLSATAIVVSPNGHVMAREER